MPPPLLLTTTIVSGNPSWAAVPSELMSWNIETSPRTVTAGAPLAAVPSAAETMPSIPLVPRLPISRSGARDFPPKVSMSRIGIDDPMVTHASFAAVVRIVLATAGSLGKSAVCSVAVTACSAVASNSAQFSAQPSGAGSVMAIVRATAAAVTGTAIVIVALLVASRVAGSTRI